MKKALQFTLGIAALVAALNFQSCDKLAKALPPQNVELTGLNADIVIPAASDTSSQITAGKTTLSVDLDAMIKTQSKAALGIELGYSSIKSLKITKLKLTLSDADAGNNFANFTSFGGDFNTDANGGNYDPYLIALVTNNPDSYNDTYEMPAATPDQDIKKYFQPQVQIYYLLVGKLRRATTKDLHCHVEVFYTISL